MFYFIAGIKNRCLEFIPLTEIEKRDSLKFFFSFNNIFEKKVLPHVYIKNQSFYIDCQQLQHILTVLSDLFFLNLSLDDFKKQIIDVTDCVPFFADGFNDFKEKIKPVQELTDLEKDIRKKFDHKFKTQLPLSCEGLKIVSLDFEFANKKDQRSEFFEMGISVQENGHFSHYHYVIGSDTKCKKGFNFGESQIIDVNDIKPIVSQHLKNAAYMVGHNVKSEYKLLDELEFEWSAFKNLKFLCTAGLVFDNFQVFRDDNTSVFDDHINLGLALKKFNVPANSLHNSGNDAVYTLRLLNSMIELKSKNLKVNPRQRKKIKIKQKSLSNQ